MRNEPQRRRVHPIATGCLESLGRLGISSNGSGCGTVMLGFLRHPNLRREPGDGFEALGEMRYRRALIEGATYFFTVNLADRSSGLLVDRVGDLREVVREVREAHPFEIVAWVVLPDHMHAVWELPGCDADYSMRWGLIKSKLSRRVPKGERIRDSRKKKGERGVWQRRFWEHLIRDDHDLQRHVDYTHFNPVKHGYVGRASDWEFSSIHRYVRLGWVDSQWGCVDECGGDFGERV